MQEGTSGGEGKKKRSLIRKQNLRRRRRGLRLGLHHLAGGLVSVWLGRDSFREEAGAVGVELGPGGLEDVGGEGPHGGGALVVVGADAAGEEVEVVLDGADEGAGDFVFDEEVAVDGGVRPFVGAGEQGRPVFGQTTVDCGVDAAVDGHGVALFGALALAELAQDGGELGVLVAELAQRELHGVQPLGGHGRHGDPARRRGERLRQHEEPPLEPHAEDVVFLAGRGPLVHEAPRRPPRRVVVRQSEGPAQQRRTAVVVLVIAAREHRGLEARTTLRRLRREIGAAGDELEVGVDVVPE
mmetsp:Transcript_7821/g.24115  ORF Transcript_7821/g.24115 Transcript_7821/m.24115 type:complete len:298 (-) Transcript_7821:50-943(-)